MVCVHKSGTESFRIVLFFQAEDGIRDKLVTGVQTCALPISRGPGHVAFAVPLAELDKWASHLRLKGTTIEHDVSWPKGGRSLYFRDPAGNCLELASPLVWGMEEAGSLARIP